MSIVFQHAPDPFWSLQAPEGLKANQLGYYCAPNQADPSYVSAYKIEEYIAYGFLTSWLSPDDFALWHLLERHDIQWLREYFLDVLEYLILAHYEGNLAEWLCKDEDETRFEGFDNDWAESLNVGNSDEGDKEEVMLTWIPHTFDVEDALCLDLECIDMVGHGHSDPSTIWLAVDAMKDRARVRSAIYWARQMNNLPVKNEYCAEQTAKRWRALGVMLVNAHADIPDIIEPMNDCFAFGKWWEKQPEEVE